MECGRDTSTVNVIRLCGWQAVLVLQHARAGRRGSESKGSSSVGAAFRPVATADVPAAKAAPKA